VDAEKCRKEAEKMLQQHIDGELSVEDSKLLAAAFLLAIKSAGEHLDAARLLAKTTKGQVLWMKWLTFTLILLGIAHVIIALHK
jgi:hypothetical protein